MNSISPQQFTQFNTLLSSLKVNTICNSALCINRPECFSRATLAFLILGETCTRNCSFCGVNQGKPHELDCSEPSNVANAVKVLGLNYVVITSVSRDDLPDQGASQFSKTIHAVRELNPHVKIEVLIPDFCGKKELLKEITNSNPEVVNHNIECAKSCFRQIRPMADYNRSLQVLADIKSLNPQITVKSGFMVGVGESIEDIRATIQDLKSVGVEIITVGQYLAPRKSSFPVRKVYNPEEFKTIEDFAKSLGFKRVFIGKNVRSSYHAENQLNFKSKDGN